MSKYTPNLHLLHENLPEKRANRLCITVSDLHFTDGTVGCQNLDSHTWDAFYGDIKARCERYGITELTFILDGDIVDLIRTSKWVENGFYPWQREEGGQSEDKFKRIVNEILKDIVENKHADFFDWLKALPANLKTDAGVEQVETIVLLGNHDKELLLDDDALKYFYEQGLGRPLSSISDKERRWLGRMYGDEDQFLKSSSVPKLPFYFADHGFRYFVTHGQWRDKSNNREISGSPGWKNSQGWQPGAWADLGYTPFIHSCFGDTVAAGVVSTFIYDVKNNLSGDEYEQFRERYSRLFTIFDELDLYRPNYKAIERVIEETKKIRKDTKNIVNTKEKSDFEGIIDIIEDTLYSTIKQWLWWDATSKLATPGVKWIVKLGKVILVLMKLFGRRARLYTIAKLLKSVTGFMKLFGNGDQQVSFKQLKSMPAFLPEYEACGFQIHGEGHTHIACEDELKLKNRKPLFTYINFGTWRDQIVGRRKTGYRRRSILRAFYILDIMEKDKETGAETGKRTFDYYTHDILHWSDKSDRFVNDGHQPHI